MHQFVSPSKLYCLAAGVAPVGTHTLEASADALTCAMCAGRIEPGDCYTPARGQFNDAFNNKIDLVEGAKHVCGHCMALWSKDWLQRYSKTYACSAGVFKLASNEDQARFILHPPAPPYVVIQSTTQQQHLIWRAPVNHSTDLIHLRFGDELLTIRRTFLLEKALPAWNALCALMKELGLKGMPASLDRELSSGSMGCVRSDVAKLATQAGQGALVQILNTLSMGEWWGINVLRQFDLSELKRDDAVRLVSPNGERATPATAEAA